MLPVTHHTSDTAKPRTVLRQRAPCFVLASFVPNPLLHGLGATPYSQLHNNEAP